MTARAWLLTLFAGFFALCGASAGGRMFWLMTIFIGLIMLLSFICVCWVRFTLKARWTTGQSRVLRAEDAAVEITCGHFCPLPLWGDIHVTLTLGGEAFDIALDPRPYALTRQSVRVRTRHVGVLSSGMTGCEITDCFGLFRLRRKLAGARSELYVLPRPFDVDALPALPQDEGASARNRTTEDLTSPEDVRAYRPGDPMKKIHWKLSYRKRELLVRRFEQLTPPDTLILLDLGRPVGGASAEDGEALLRDALCETTVSCAQMQINRDEPVRVPLYGGQKGEYRSERGGSVQGLQEMLCMQDFSQAEPYARVLQLELRRMRRTGTTFMITTRLDAEITQGIIHIRRMGPGARLYLITFTPDAPEYRPYVTRLQRQMVEVCYVTPNV